jgi:HD-like signal output (HDOD) protein
MELDSLDRLEIDEIVIPPTVKDCLEERLQKLQMLPEIAQQALEMIKDPDCTIRSLARLIEQDIKLATEMLRMANSAIYSQGRVVATLTEATMRMGLQQCKNLILTSSFASLIENFSLEEEWVRDLLWRHGLVTAVFCSNINRTLKAGFQGEEFTAGLIHDVGRILLATALPERFLQADAVDFREQGSQLLRNEFEILGTTHTEVGAWFARQNRLPDCLVAAIRYHHFPTRPSRDQRLAALVAVADDVANFVQCHQSGEGYDFNQNPFIDCLEDCGVAGARRKLVDAAAEILSKSSEDALQLCGS